MIRTPWLFVLSLALASPAAADSRVIDAARRGDAAAVRMLLKQGASVKTAQGDGATALHWAAHHDSLDIANAVLAAGANVNAVNDLGVSPLWLACQNGSAAMSERLLRAGANATLTLPSGETLLMTAARTGNPDIVKQLLAAGANVNAKEGSRGQTAIMWAAAQGHSAIVRLLLEAGASLKERSDVRPRRVNTETSGFGKEILAEVEMGGYTPLLFAARSGDLESARLMLAAGADVNDTAPQGTSALVVALHSMHFPLAALLLDKGADPNVAGAGYTALHTAILHGRVELVTALLAKGADPNAPLKQGTPARRASPDYVISGEYVGADPVWLAARFGEPEIMRLLAKQGAKTSGVVKGTTVLHSAVQATRRTDPGVTVDNAAREKLMVETVTAALDLGGDVKAIDEEGNTALHLAVSRRQTAVAKLLVGRGARLDVKNKKDQTPVSLAAGNKAMEELLRSLESAGR